MEHVHVISVDGHYQVVAFTRDARYDPDDIIGYGVTTTAGGVLRHAISAEDARNWLQWCVEEEVLGRRAPGRPASASITPVSNNRTRRGRP